MSHLKLEQAAKSTPEAFTSNGSAPAACTMSA
jgi:hypothetical protein